MIYIGYLFRIIDFMKREQLIKAIPFIIVAMMISGPFLIEYGYPIRAYICYGILAVGAVCLLTMRHRGTLEGTIKSRQLIHHAGSSNNSYCRLIYVSILLRFFKVKFSHGGFSIGSEQVEKRRVICERLLYFNLTRRKIVKKRRALFERPC